MSEASPFTDWMIWRGHGEPHEGIERLPDPPPWRRFDPRAGHRAASYRPGDREVAAVNAALYLRRPLLVTGPPGSGKSTVAHAVARELNLGDVLHWPVNSRTTLDGGLYQYDAIARLRDANLAQAKLARTEGSAEVSPEDIGQYLTLGPLGTALWSAPDTDNDSKHRLRVLLIDEIDKSDIDFPNDLLPSQVAASSRALRVKNELFGWLLPGVRLPVVEIEPTQVARWARMAMAVGGDCGTGLRAGR